MIDNVLIDMDGVLVDYYRSILQHTKATITYDEWPPGCDQYEHLFGMTYDEVMQNAEDDFWRDMPPTPWMDVLLRLVCIHPNTASSEAHILTSPPYIHHHRDIEPCHVAQSVKGKLEWVLAHMPEYYHSGSISFSWKKYIAGRPSSLLIDDSAANIDSFVENGGKGILVPGLHNRRHAEYHCILEDPCTWFKEEFDKLSQRA